MQKYPEKLAACGLGWPAGSTQTCGVQTVENLCLLGFWHACL